MKLSVLFVLAVIITAAMGLATSVSAQEIVVETSADDHGDRFFGEGILQIVITDQDADDDDTVEEISVEIKADPDGVGGSSEDIAVPETNEGSGKFELFLVHVDATAVGPADLDPINTAGVEGDGTCVADCAPFVTFGPGGDIDFDSNLYEDVRFEILADITEIAISYEETAGTLELDRDSYGTTSFVYVSVVDQDANLNPTERDEFTVDPDSDPNDDLLVLDGGAFEDAIVFRETGDNTGIFKGKYRLGESILVDSESPVLTLFDKANYGATLAALENDSNDIDEISFMIGNSDGMVVGAGQQSEPTWDPVIAVDKDSYAIEETVHVTITDRDANDDSSSIDSIQMWVSSASREIDISALETGVNTGVFEASFTLSETDTGQGAIVPGSSATITYTDERPADYFEKVQAGQNPEKDFAIEIDIEVPLKTGIDATSVAAPVTTNIAGVGGPFTVGSSLTFSTSIDNNNEQVQGFITVIEVRNSEGVTVYLALQGGTLEPDGSADIDVLWQPDLAGTFEIRTFAITGFDEAELLSRPAISAVVIS